LFTPANVIVAPLPNGGKVLTYIRPGKKTGRLRELVKELPWDHNTQGYLPLCRMQIFTALDETLSLSMFIYGDSDKNVSDIGKSGAKILAFAEELQNGAYQEYENHPKPSPKFERDNLLKYMHKCSESYISRIDPLRFLQHKELFDQVTGSEGVAVRVQESYMDDTHEHFWVDIAVASSLPQVALEHAASLLYLHKFDVIRSHLDMVS